MSSPPKYYGNSSSSSYPYDTKILTSNTDASSSKRSPHPAASSPPTEDPFMNPSSDATNPYGSVDYSQPQGRPDFAPAAYPGGSSSSSGAGPSSYRASAPFEQVLADYGEPRPENSPPSFPSSSYPQYGTPPGLPPLGHRQISSGSYDSDLDQYGAGASKPRDTLKDGATIPLFPGEKDKSKNNRRSGGSDFEARLPMDQMGYQDPYGAAEFEGASPPLSTETQKPPNFFEKMFGGSPLSGPLEQRIENRRRGVTKQKYPFLAWGLSAAMVGVMIYELVYNQRQQGSPFSFKPFANVMLGPSQVGLISLGARWPACMRNVSSIPPTLELGCPSNTANPPTNICTIEQICAFGGFHNETPNQWWRFITPIFLHAGLIHIAFNLFAQLTLSAQVEREIGSIAFFILYFAAGIFGNVLGGNFALVGLPSVGASGAIFGTVGVLWVDLLAHWGLERTPGKKLGLLITDLVVGIGLGFIPGVDNFVHLGGFLLGLISAAIFYPVISTTKRHKTIMWGIRLAMLPLAIVLYVVLIRNFYSANPFEACSWCRYLSCIPTSSNNHCQGTGITTTTST